MLKIAICEDEEYMLKEIEKSVQIYMASKNTDFKIDCFKSGEELLACDFDYELILLDIQMEGIQGLEAASMLRSRKYMGLIIFITALKECVFDSFKVEAFDYLLKPLNYEALSRTLDRAFERISTNKDKKLVIQRNNDRIIIPFCEIIYCEAINRKIYIHTEKKVIDYYEKLEELEQILGDGFYRCHRSYLINLAYVNGSRNGIAHLGKEEKVPISRLREQDFSKVILNYMKGKGC